MQPSTDLTEQQNLIEWRKPIELTPEAKELITLFLSKMRRVIHSLVANEHILPGEAFDIARTARPHSLTHQELVDNLFSNAVFRGAGVRETLIFPIVSYYSWDEDEQLKLLENPWLPIMELYRQGYTTDFDVSPDWKEVTMIIGYGGHNDIYRIV